jgi:hypothetical protein
MQITLGPLSGRTYDTVAGAALVALLAGQPACRRALTGVLA